MIISGGLIIIKMTVLFFRSVSFIIGRGTKSLLFSRKLKKNSNSRAQVTVATATNRYSRMVCYHLRQKRNTNCLISSEDKEGQNPIG